MLKTVPFLVLAASALYAGSTGDSPSRESKEEFLKTAKVKQVHGAKKGITNTVRATLTDGTTTHDASIQRIDEEKARFETAQGVEVGFRDTYRFNIAAYRLGLLLGLGDMIPPSVERTYEGSKAAWTWWVDNVAMDEVERLKRKAKDPDKDHWGRQYLIMKVFDQLIYNIDRNQQNILYDQDWKLWMIDHTRSFRTRTDLLDAKALDRCDRVLFERMKALTEKDVRNAIGPWVRDPEIQGLMARRDKIVAFFEKKGDSAFYDYLPKAAAAGR